MSLLAKYTRFLEMRPVLGRCLTTGVLACTGDFIAQIFIEKKSFFMKNSKNALNANKNSRKREARAGQFCLKRSWRAFVMGFSILSLNMYAWYHKCVPFLLRVFSQVRVVTRFPNATVTVLGILHFSASDFRPNVFRTLDVPELLVRDFHADST